MARAVWILMTVALCLSGGQRLGAQADYETTRIAEGVCQFRWQW
jgi:hypothetical protein